MGAGHRLIAGGDDILRRVGAVQQLDERFGVLGTVGVGDADGLYAALVRRGIIVRNRNRVQKCQGCLRITIGLPAENDLLLEAIRKEVEA